MVMVVVCLLMLAAASARALGDISRSTKRCCTRRVIAGSRV
jgi:hypothetical protein